MKETLESLEQRRLELIRGIGGVGDFRRGIISVNYRKCGKRNCACAQKGHRGHGPQYLCNTTVAGKSRAANLRLGPELEKAEREVGSCRRFNELMKEFVDVNEKICQLRPVREIGSADELDALKKTLQRRFGRKLNRKSGGR